MACLLHLETAYMCWLGDLITALLVWFEGRKEVEGKEEGMMARGSGWGICLVLVGRAGLGFSFACCELV